MTDTVEKYLEKQKAKEKPLRLVLTDHWFEEIKSGRKKYEYRKATQFWLRRIERACNLIAVSNKIYVKMPEEYMPFVEFQKAYRKNAEKMEFKIKDITLVDGNNTDLKIDDLVFDIKLGERVR